MKEPRLAKIIRMPEPAQQKIILFVDDEPSIRITLPAILRKAGFEVRVAENVTAALERIKGEQFDCLVTDLKIGKASDGLEVAKNMREIQPNCAIFILTGYPAFETAVEAIRTPVDDYLVKPVDLETLITKIKNRLQRDAAPKGSTASKSR